jgi:hypothetical protein
VEDLTRSQLEGLVEFLMDGYGVGDLDAFAVHLIRGFPTRPWAILPIVSFDIGPHDL